MTEWVAGMPHAEARGQMTAHRAHRALNTLAAHRALQPLSARRPRRARRCGALATHRAL